MGLFDLFGRKRRMQPAEKEEDDTAKTGAYSGMRAEVTTFDGRLLFVAKLLGVRGETAELHQYSEIEIEEDDGPIHVRIRGYNDHERKAVYLEGVITPRPKNVWHVEELTVARVGNDRSFFRLTTNLDATATAFKGEAAGERPCKLLNISVGGACVGSEYEYQMEDKFLLKVRLLEDRPPSAMFCQVLRIIKKDGAGYEYGCRFLELTEEDQEKITQNIFEAQRKKRAKN